MVRKRKFGKRYYIYTKSFTTNKDADKCANYYRNERNYLARVKWSKRKLRYEVFTIPKEK